MSRFTQSLVNYKQISLLGIIKQRSLVVFFLSNIPKTNLPKIEFGSHNEQR